MQKNTIKISQMIRDDDPIYPISRGFSIVDPLGRSDLAEVLWALRSVLLSYYRAASAVRAKWAGCSARQAEAIQNAEPSFVEWTTASRPSFAECVSASSTFARMRIRPRVNSPLNWVPEANRILRNLR